MTIRMAKPVIDKTAVANVLDVLKSGWLSRRKWIPAFEQEVARLHGAKHGVLVNSGTDALRISLAVLKEVHGWHDGDRIYVPALTFVATVNAVLQNNLKPEFKEVELDTGNFHPWAYTYDSMAKVPVRAAIPVHLFGYPARFEKSRKEYPVIEDSCETFGVHKLRGEMACFSFFASHHISTGVGGMILTNDKNYERIARSLANHGRVDDGSRFEFGRVGYSSRITELEAAVGMAALERWPEELEQRKQLAVLYREGLEGLPLVHAPAENHSWMFYPVRMLEGNREKLMEKLKRNGIESRQAMPLINQSVFQKMYERGSCPNAEVWTEQGLLLPLHPQMTEKDVNVVARRVRQFYA